MAREAARKSNEAENSNWVSSLVVPASRKIGNLLSAVFISDTTSSDEDYISDDDVNCDNDGDGYPNESNLESERKHTIKQLLLQETFSREECDMLVKIIHSRVDSALIPGRRVLNVTPDHAVMEAKRFLEEKRAGRSPQSEFGHGSIGSPADMAKSYMQDRPPWASPSTGNFELRTPSTMLRQLTSEEKPHSVLKDSVTHLKERNHPASGAWNMQDEIRRLRAKASEDMVCPLSSSKVDLSVRSPLPRSSQDNGVNVLGADSNKDISASDIREGAIIEASLDPERKQVLKANQNESERAVSDPPVIPDHAGTDINSGSRNDTVNGESLSQNSLDGLSQGQSQEQSETEGKNGVALKSDSKGRKRQEKKPVRRQPKRQKKG